MKKYREFSADLKKKFLLISIIPIVIVSAFLLGKIYFTFEDSNIKSHIKVLKDIDFYIDTLLKEIEQKSSFIEHNFHKIDLDKFLIANYEIETAIIFDKKSHKVLKLGTRFDLPQSKKEEYLKNNPYEKYKDIKEAKLNTVHKSIDGKDKTVSYILPTKDYLFVFDINLNIIKSYIDYIQKSINYIILIVDKDGNYVYKSSNGNYFHDNFFKTEYYKKVVSKYEPLKYVEFYNEEQGEDNFMSYYKSNDTGWTIVTLVDSDILDDQVLGLMFFVVILIPIVILIIIILSKKFTLKIVTPLEILISKMETISTTSDMKKITIDDLEYSLFKRMIESFNAMQEKIIHREEQLKNSNKLLVKKTQEISALNETLQDRVKEEIDKNRKKDQQILQQSRLAQMGEMISMIAHQWRQPLAAISSTSMALHVKARLNKIDKETVMDLTEKISGYAQHLSSTIDDFREFFKANKEKKEITYTKLIDSVLSIIETSLKNKNIKLVKDYRVKKFFIHIQMS